MDTKPYQSEKDFWVRQCIHAIDAILLANGNTEASVMLLPLSDIDVSEMVAGHYHDRGYVVNHDQTVHPKTKAQRYSIYVYPSEGGIRIDSSDDTDKPKESPKVLNAVAGVRV